MAHLASLRLEWFCREKVQEVLRAEAQVVTLCFPEVTRKGWGLVRRASPG